MTADEIDKSDNGIYLRLLFAPSTALAEHFQLERGAHFYLDPNSTPGKLIFNRTLAL